jgi:hypothetical protein
VVVDGRLCEKQAISCFSSAEKRESARARAMKSFCMDCDP